MKTLDEIINRNDYKMENKALVKRAEQLAIFFRDKMRYFGMSYQPCEEDQPRKGMSITVNNNTYTVRKMNWYLNGELYKSEYYFARLVYHNDYCEGPYPARYYFDYEANFNCDGDMDHEATYTIYVEFLNDAKEILKALDDIETRRVVEINNAIDNSKDIAV
jgi:hypothetical protein